MVFRALECSLPVGRLSMTLRLDTLWRQVPSVEGFRFSVQSLGLRLACILSLEAELPALTWIPYALKSTPRTYSGVPHRVQVLSGTSFANPVAL